MKKNLAGNQSGFGLLELTVAIIIVGLLLAVAMQSMTSIVEDTRKTKTEREMELLSESIVGDPDDTQGGGRVDFGYVGDIGAFPPNINALYSNPGGYATWDGPYLPPGFTQDSTGLKTDEWGAAYNYSGGATVTSTGSGTTITKNIARLTTDYLRNTVTGIIRDGAGSLPGATKKDSVDIKITIPNGSGGTLTKLYRPDASGNITLDSIPAGTHPLRIIYTPSADTIFRYFTVYPRHKSPATFKFASTHFTGAVSAGLVYVSSSAYTTSGNGNNCNRIVFNIRNTSASNITVTNMTLTWSSPTAYYRRIIFGGNTVFNQTNPRLGSGQQANFSSGRTVNSGQTVTVRVESFRNATNGGNTVNMSNTNMTITFSDGSVITFNSGACI